MAKSTRHMLINILLFQCTWFALVVGPLLLGAGLLLCLLLHVATISSDKKAEAKLCASVLAIGVLSDSLLMTVGVYQLGVGQAADNLLIPMWLMLLWLAFSLTLKHSLNWLSEFPWLMVILLGVFGPVSYYAGSQLSPDRIQINHSLLPASVLQWAIVGALVIGLNKILFKHSKNETIIK